MRVAHRFQGTHEHYKGTTKLTGFGPHWTGVVNQAPLGIIEQPLRWTRPRMVFVNSMSDLFHESVPFEFVAAIFGIMASCLQHTFQVLTKRPDRMLEFLTVWLPRFADEQRGIAQAPSEVQACLRAAFDLLGGEEGISTKNRKALDAVWRQANEQELWPLSNVWLGTSIEDQRAAEERLLTLLQVPAAIRWISAEPLLGPVVLGLLGALPGDLFPGYQMVWQRLHWVVVGGESGPGARPMAPAWAEALRQECADARVPFLFKQWGDWAPASPVVELEDGGVVDLPRIDIDGIKLRKKVADGHRVFQSVDGMWMERVGKKKAGRHLGGELHDGYPEREAA